MSWWINVTGTLAEVKAKAADQFETAAKGYDTSNPVEAADIRQAGARVDARLVQIMGASNLEGVNGARVDANGSGSTSPSSTSTMRVEVQPLRLALGETNPPPVAHPPVVNVAPVADEPTTPQTPDAKAK